MHDLYLVKRDDGNGEDLDLFVYASSPEEAYDLWGAFYWGGEWQSGQPNSELSDLPGVIVLGSDTKAEMRIFKINQDNATARALSWDAPDVEEVAHMREL